jgi:hypothetical protein
MPDDPWDPDNPPPYWVDEDGHFAGWMSEAEQATLDAQFAEAAEAMDETPPLRHRHRGSPGRPATTSSTSDRT